MHYLAKLAKTTTEHYVKTSQVLMPPAHFPSQHAQQRACYVHLYENPGRRLKAVGGHPLPRKSSLAEEIIAHTIDAVHRNHATRVRRPELAALVYRVAVLEPLQRISQPAQLNPTTSGLYIRSDQGKAAIILPGRTGVETPQDQIATALRESGINLRQEAATMYRFGVTYYE